MQLKNIDDMDTPDEVSLEDAMRMKKTKKKELKKLSRKEKHLELKNSKQFSKILS